MVLAKPNLEMFVVFFSLYVIVSLSGQVAAFSGTIYAVNVTRGLVANMPDMFILAAYGTTTKCDDLINQSSTALKAHCTVVKPTETDTMGTCILNCTCRVATSSFIINQKSCNDEREFRQGRKC